MLFRGIWKLLRKNQLWALIFLGNLIINGLSFVLFFFAILSRSKLDFHIEWIPCCSFLKLFFLSGWRLQFTAFVWHCSATLCQSQIDRCSLLFFLFYLFLVITFEDILYLAPDFFHPTWLILHYCDRGNKCILIDKFLITWNLIILLSCCIWLKLWLYLFTANLISFFLLSQSFFEEKSLFLIVASADRSHFRVDIQLSKHVVLSG